MVDFSQLAILVFSSASIYAFAGKKNTWLGFVFGLCGQPFWIYTSYISGQWGVFIVSLWFTGNHVRGLLNYLNKLEVSDEG